MSLARFMCISLFLKSQYTEKEQQDRMCVFVYLGRHKETIKCDFCLHLWSSSAVRPRCPLAYILLNNYCLSSISRRLCASPKMKGELGHC